MSEYDTMGLNPKALKNIKDALSEVPTEYRELIEKRGDLQLEMNDARQYGDDLTELRKKMKSINEQIENFKVENIDSREEKWQQKLNGNDCCTTNLIVKI